MDKGRDNTPETARDAMDPSWRLETRAIRAGREWSGSSLSPVLFPSTTYEVDDVAEHAVMAGQARPTHYYSRFGSPTVRDFEDAVAALEGAEAALAFSSGMAAVTAVILGLCSKGDHVVAQRQVFSATSTLFLAHCPRFGIDVTIVDGTRTDDFVEAVRPGQTQVVFIETPGNPALSLTDIAAVAAIPGPFTVVDSTFATPVAQRPLDHGADLVLHAATKGLAGHNDALLGVVAGSRELIDAVWAWHLVQGGQASPFDAWNGIRGIRTLSARVHQQATTALALAERLEAHDAVAAVSYPGLDSHPQRALAKRLMPGPAGAILSVDLKGGALAVEGFMKRSRLMEFAPSFADVATTWTYPARTSHRRVSDETKAEMGIGAGLIRISVGLEKVEDLIGDAKGALA